MKALTICQPYPFLILAENCEPVPGVERKRVENRTWEMIYRGPLLVHAGKSKKWLAGWNIKQLPPLDFGCIVGVVNVVDCIAVASFMGPRSQWSEKLDKYPWLPGHQHTEGPFCIVMENPRRFAKPIPYTGALGMFNVPDEVVAEQLEAINP